MTPMLEETHGPEVVEEAVLPDLGDLEGHTG